MSAASASYAHLSRADLIARLSQLERTDASTSAIPAARAPSLPSSKGGSKKQSKKAREAPTVASQSEFFDRYPSRKIALRFCYEGWLYGGLALQNEDTPLPTVEGVLLEALVKARLIKNADDLEEIDFSRCGRTDRGVSAAGQVVSLYIRSQLRSEEGQHEKGWRPAVVQASTAEEHGLSAEQEASLSEQEKESLRQKAAAKNKAREELPYMHLLNRALPPSIRILAWSPVLPDFDSRFSCRSRHYKYFFSSDSTSSSWLDIEAMREGASKLVGEHDYRNLCKVDATKQITNFRRKVMSATITQLPTPHGQQDIMYVFDLQGTAFLYHQVRHIMAILFLVASGKERPEIVDTLLNTGYADEKGPADDTALRKDLPTIPSKPAYEMADDLPLVLWDCAFPDGALDWRQDGQSKQSFGMQEHNMRHRLKATISEHFDQAFQSFANKAAPTEKQFASIQIGAGRVITTGRYIPLLDRPRSQFVEEINARWAEGQGKRRAERKAKEVQEIDVED